MKLVVQCPQGHELTLSLKADVRSDLPPYSDVQCPHDQLSFGIYPHEVTAKSGSNQTVGGAALGGLVGLLGGPAGLFIGALAGGALGASTKVTDAERVRRFNAS